MGLCRIIEALHLRKLVLSWWLYVIRLRRVPQLAGIASGGIISPLSMRREGSVVQVGILYASLRLRSRHLCSRWFCVSTVLVTAVRVKVCRIRSVLSYDDCQLHYRFRKPNMEAVPGISEGRDIIVSKLSAVKTIRLPDYAKPRAGGATPQTTRV